MSFKKQVYLFLGAPGSGKTTYAFILNEFLISLGKRTAYVNLDCSNNSLLNDVSVDFRDIILGEEILPELHIGPNCSIFFSIEYLLENLDWLEMETKIITSKNYTTYFLFDLPGQIELFTHHESLRKMVRKFKRNKFSFSTLILSDSFFWYDKTNFHILALSNLMMVFNIETAFFHILTKTDLIKKYEQYEENKIEEKSKIFQDETQNIFSWSNKFRFSIEDVILDFGMIYPTPINLNQNIHLLNLVKNLEKLN